MPADFINKLSRMFQDIKVSEDLNNQFKEQQKDRDTKTGDSVIKNVPIASAMIPSRQVSIKILNVGAWARTSERVPVTLPRELEDFIPEVNFCHTLKSAYPFPPPPTPLCISQYFLAPRWRSSTRPSTVAESCSGTTICPMAQLPLPTSKEFLWTLSS